MKRACSDVKFSQIRGDWYNSNSLMTRLVIGQLKGKNHHRFVGFPRQWIPVFIWLSVPWKGSCAPQRHIPVFSDLRETEIAQMAESAMKTGSLRTLVECASVCDSVIADFLDQVDKSGLPIIHGPHPSEGLNQPKLMLTTWQSYGQPSVRRVDSAVLSIRSDRKYALILPCSSKRPYGNSLTHRKLYRRLTALGVDLNAHHRIVVSALGFIPEEIWHLPEVLAYDAGVPDVYRLLGLGRQYFAAQNYSKVIDCQSDDRYSDVLSILSREGSLSLDSFHLGLRTRVHRRAGGLTSKAASLILRPKRNTIC
jgi:hypothetical protein